MSIEAGGTFVCNDNALTNDDQHMWIIVSDPVAYPECVVVVNLSSSTNKSHDPACNLKQRDHPSVRHASFVYYARARVLTLQTLEAANISRKPTVTPGLLARIREGAVKTDRLPRYIKQHLIDQQIIPAPDSPTP